jgi:ribonuclease HI
MAVSNQSPDGNVIALFADGSFSDEVGIGAWAFRAPALDLEGVGSAEGRSVVRFEFLAVLHGLEAVDDVDKSALPIHVFSDCDSTVAAIERLRAGLPLKNPEKYADRSDLIPRLQTVLERRDVRVTRFGLGRLEHQACHRAAAAKLRDEVRNNPIAHHQTALKRQRSRLAQLVGERGVVLKRLDKLDDEISLIQIEIAALELSMHQLSSASSGGLAAEATSLAHHDGLSAPELSFRENGALGSGRSVGDGWDRGLNL